MCICAENSNSQRAFARYPTSKSGQFRIQRIMDNMLTSSDYCTHMYGRDISLMAWAVVCYSV